MIKGNIVKIDGKGKIKLSLKAKQGMILKRWVNEKVPGNVRMFRY